MVVSRKEAEWGPESLCLGPRFAIYCVESLVETLFSRMKVKRGVLILTAPVKKIMDN